MTEWPRAIRPEDRVKYLVNARAEVGIFPWHPQEDVLIGFTDWSERVWIAREAEVYEAWFSSNYEPERLIGEFDTLREAQKALIDHLVVVTAVRQAWEDVAT